ncbi:phosphoribosylanthranilate isomerase [Deinococcus sp. KNUC1210]|uniref:phosphoribosylanthranilate isomerase n=1 Tax=Deinococcus sp. KNUC1210 TaxID=2917691 RepID=UPI001EF0B624|nr:phosphoribosylanthranilate isomerase [Deinococcus sp. KNUC1210]ULH14743.1 phosphoribosylanthranilate isomerase [Deinococcus sp. KNUC1210]
MSALRVKICGTTNLPDALLSLDAGADAIGLIFAPISKRLVSVETAREISVAVGPALGRVGVFLDQPLSEVLRTAERARVSAVQIHGPVSGLYLQTLERYYPVLRVVRPADLQQFSQATPGHTLMLDAPTPGSGEALDWQTLEPVFPAGGWLAGGLGPDNVAQAIRVLHPAGVDAVSRLERSPGVKDSLRVRAFVRAARQAQQALEDT